MNETVTTADVLASPTQYSCERDPNAFYAAVHTHKTIISDAWCPPGTTTTLVVSNPEHELDLVFGDDLPAAAAALISRLEDDQLLAILRDRFGSGTLALPQLD